MSVILTRNGKAAQRLEPGEIPQESLLQEYILANPEALPLSDLHDDFQFLVLGREFPTASGPVDAVGLDDLGNFYLIETKLYRNPDKRRVLAQVMDYGAALWKRHGDATSFREELRSTARRYLEMDLEQKVRKAFDVNAKTAEELLRTAEQQVADGRFRFIILMDHLDEHLRDLISFINENSRFDVFGVELQFYRFDDYELTMPKLYGAEARKEVATTARTQWDEESYFAHAQTRLRGEQLDALRRLYDFARSHADQISWGTGKLKGSFNLKYEHLNPTKSLLSVYSHGKIELNFAWFHGPEEPLPEWIEHFAQRVNQLDGFELPENYASTYVQVRKEIWMPQVEALIEAMRSSIRQDL